MQDRKRYREHCRQHLQVLDLIEQGRLVEASDALRSHLASTLKNLKKISSLLKP
jgi:DNA-binding GntR family transcriptional regulator